MSANSELTTDNAQWFVIHTYSGYENKVKANLEKRLVTMNMQDKIFRVVVPEEEEVEYKDGKRRLSAKSIPWVCRCKYDFDG